MSATASDLRSPPQLIITIAHAQAWLEGTDETLSLTSIDARDTEAVLAVVGRWLMAARTPQGANGGAAP